MRKSVVLAAFAVLLAAFSSAEAKKKAPKTPPQPTLSQDQKILHALNRLTFGPRPADLDNIRKVGLEQWIDGQLHPQNIKENAMLESRLSLLASLKMSNRELTENFPPPQAIAATAQGRMPMPSDPERRAVMQKLVARYKEGKQGPPNREAAMKIMTAEDRRAMRGSAAERVAYLKSLTMEHLFDLVSVMPPQNRMALLAGADPEFRERLQKVGGTAQMAAQQLFEQKLLRAVYGERQLEEVLTDFWFNHFNVYLQKGADLYLTMGYERDAIRPHVLGKFQDMLTATAKAPAMLFYLDNWQSVGADSPAARFARNARMPMPVAARGLNENYGRELMELHTLGVDGGYTQKDVTEAARCFTGWTIREPQRGGEFFFNPRMHDASEKTVLGVKIPAGGGIEDGIKVLDIVAHHPSTARFISKKLAMRFVSDNPPQPLVDRMAKTFTATDGDLRAVMKTMLASPEFWSPDVYRTKLKSPLEMVASAVRALDAKVEFTFSLNQEIAQLGQPLYRKEEPTGYSNDSSGWMNSAALLARMNFGISLASNKLMGVRVSEYQLTSAAADPASLAQKLLSTEPSQAVKDTLAKGLAESSGDEAQKMKLAAGLTIGSPDFQRR